MSAHSRSINQACDELRCEPTSQSPPTLPPTRSPSATSTLVFVALSPFGHMFGSSRLTICISWRRCSLLPVTLPDGVASVGALDALRDESGDFPFPVDVGIGGTAGSCCSFLVSGTASLLLLARCAKVRAWEKPKPVVARGRPRG